jgi:hypothetical protein
MHMGLESRKIVLQRVRLYMMMEAGWKLTRYIKLAMLLLDPMQVSKSRRSCLVQRLRTYFVGSAGLCLRFARSKIVAKCDGIVQEVARWP